MPSEQRNSKEPGRSIDRRRFLEAGGRGMLGIGATSLGQSSSAQSDTTARPSASTFGRAKSVVILYL
jgi:hypothetical protein